MASSPNVPFMFILLPLVVGGIIVGIALYFWRTGYRLQLDATSAKATVIGKQQITDTFWDYNDLTVRFTDATGTEHTAVFRVQREYTGIVDVGSVIPITYPAGRPEQVAMGTVWGRRLTGGLVSLIGAVGIGLLGFALWLLAGRA